MIGHDDAKALRRRNGNSQSSSKNINISVQRQCKEKLANWWAVADVVASYASTSVNKRSFRHHCCASIRSLSLTDTHTRDIRTRIFSKSAYIFAKRIGYHYFVSKNRNLFVMATSDEIAPEHHVSDLRRNCIVRVRNIWRRMYTSLSACVHFQVDGKSHDATGHDWAKYQNV